MKDSRDFLDRGIDKNDAQLVYCSIGLHGAGRHPHKTSHTPLRAWLDLRQRNPNRMLDTDGLVSWRA